MLEPWTPPSSTPRAKELRPTRRPLLEPRATQARLEELLSPWLSPECTHQLWSETWETAHVTPTSLWAWVQLYGADIAALAVAAHVGEDELKRHVTDHLPPDRVSSDARRPQLLPLRDPCGPTPYRALRRRDGPCRHSPRPSADRLPSRHPCGHRHRRLRRDPGPLTPAAEELLGYGRDDLVGQSLRDVHVRRRAGGSRERARRRSARRARCRLRRRPRWVGPLRAAALDLRARGRDQSPRRHHGHRGVRRRQGRRGVRRRSAAAPAGARAGHAR